MFIDTVLSTCHNLAVDPNIMHHVIKIESSYNPYAIGVVGGRLVRQPNNLAEAIATAKMLEENGYNFSLGLAQVNRYNLKKYGLFSYQKAFDQCSNIQAGSRILSECYQRSGSDWGKAFSCYYSGNFVTGYQHGYVQKVINSIQNSEQADYLDINNNSENNLLNKNNKKLTPEQMRVALRSQSFSDDGELSDNRNSSDDGEFSGNGEFLDDRERSDNGEISEYENISDDQEYSDSEITNKFTNIQKNTANKVENTGIAIPTKQSKNPEKSLPQNINSHLNKNNQFNEKPVKPKVDSAFVF